MITFLIRHLRKPRFLYIRWRPFISLGVQEVDWVWSMTNSVIPFPHPEVSHEDEELVRIASQNLLESVSNQPVPERLQELALELGWALDQRPFPGAEDTAPKGPQPER